MPESGKFGIKPAEGCGPAGVYCWIKFLLAEFRFDECSKTRVCFYIGDRLLIALAVY